MTTLYGNPCMPRRALRRQDLVIRQVRGFTLIELMVTVTILIILMSLAVPSFSRLLASNRLSMQTNEFVAALNVARMEAVRRTLTVSLRAADNDENFHKGWTVFPDINADGTAADSTDVFRVNSALSGNTTITRVTFDGTNYSTSADGDRGFIAFTSRGAKAAGGKAFFKICDSGNTAISGRIVRVLTAGTISVISSTASCS